MTNTWPAPLYICVFVPEFPAQTLLRHRPELRKAAVCVLEGAAPFERVSSVNAPAARLGAAHGMTRAELDSFSGITVLRRAEAEERAAQTALAEAAGTFTPRVELCSPAAPGVAAKAAASVAVCSLMLDMSGTDRLFGPVTEILNRLGETAGDLRLHVQLAASANFHAALCAAPYARSRPIVLEPGRERDGVAALPLRALGLTAFEAGQLDLWGLRSVGELAALPETDLVARLGQRGRRLRLLARGEYPHLMVPEEPAFRLEELIEFEAPVELLDSLLFVAGPMLDQLLVRARDRAYALASLTVTLGLDGGGTHRRVLKPALPVCERDILLKLLHLDLQAHPPPVAVVSLKLQAEPGSTSKVQMGLYAPPLPEATRLDVTLARIGATVGEGRAGRARLLDRHGREAFTMERFTVPGSAPAADDPVPGMRAVVARRCRPPQPVRVRRRGALLEEFRLRQSVYTVEQAFGPWRKSGQWWSGEVWSFEEWDVCGATAEGTRLLCVIAHDLLRDQWQLEAVYD